MSSLMTALGVELLKLKRTLALALAVIGPLVPGLLQCASLLERARYGLYEVEDPWGLQAHNVLLIYNLLMLPLFITLQTALVAGLEHNARSWKRLFSLPLSRATIYVAKQIVMLGLIGLSMVVVVVEIPVLGLALNAIDPKLSLTLDTVPWGQILRTAGAAYLLSWSLVALHTWIASRWPSFVVACTAGVVATITGGLIWSSRYGVYYPWTIPGVVGHEVYYPETGVAFATILIGFLIAPIITLLGCWDVTHRDALSTL